MNKTIYTRYMSAEYKRRMRLRKLAAAGIGFCIGWTVMSFPLWALQMLGLIG